MPGKHVIFLGAGASMSSGYPSAERLRIILGDEAAFRQYALDHNPGLNTYELHALVDLRSQFREALDYFRFGCFGSIDEFCKLADGRMPEQVQQLKKMVRMVLGLANPEAGYTSSDYYPFVQRLFQQASPEFREDIVLLTYNYDPYLPLLLTRAASERQKVHTGAVTLDARVYNDLTSGFGSGGDAAWVNRGGFQLLALHGFISFPAPPFRVGTQPDLHFATMIKPGEESRLAQLANSFRFDPPLIFPWELFNDDGSLRNGDDGSSFWKRETPLYPGKSLRDCFAEIWGKARAAVQAADRISFVGIAMHSYLHGGLRFLLQGKTGSPDILSVSRQNVGKNGDAGPEFTRTTPAAKLRNLLRNVCPDLKPPAEPYRRVVHRDGGTTVRTIAEFSDFIQKEL